MANVDRANGFKFSKSLLGTAPNAMIRLYTASDRSADTTGNHGDIHLGDPVKLVSGLVLPANSGRQCRRRNASFRGGELRSSSIGTGYVELSLEGARESLTFMPEPRSSRKPDR